MKKFKDPVEEIIVLVLFLDAIGFLLYVGVTSKGGIDYEETYRT